MKKIIIFSAMMLSMWIGLVSAQPMDGKEKTYYENGQVMAITEYSKGVKHGISQVFDEQGKLKYEEIYVKGAMVDKIFPAPKRDYGPFKVFANPLFWVGFVAVCGLLWFLFSKVLLKNQHI